MKLVDTHCHIDSDRYDEDRDIILKEIEENLEFAVNIGYDLESSKRSVELADKYEFMYAVVGVHPTDINGYNDELEESLEKLAENPKVVAIGEIGLDYHWMKDEKEEQKKIFRRQLELSRRVKKPVVIHTRDATADTIEILKEYKDIKGILHCYPGSYESALELMNNYYFGIGGVVTFKNSKKTVEAVSKIPLDRLVIETDAPYLTPTPFRGKRNHPIYVEYVAQKIAEIKGVSYEEVVRVTTENAMKVYGI
jgi:TatD DNase family protein